ncbi:hypothetical protein [Roseovarius aestuariivivens]|nr:hypothetical protein [Roseovarius aestuariivivens]
MFGLIRLVIFAALAFVAGVLYERSDQRGECPGTYRAGLCYVEGGSDV